jgi:hypothetical protein
MTPEQFDIVEAHQRLQGKREKPREQFLRFCRAIFPDQQEFSALFVPTVQDLEELSHAPTLDLLKNLDLALGGMGRAQQFFRDFPVFLQLVRNGGVYRVAHDREDSGLVPKSLPRDTSRDGVCDDDIYELWDSEASEDGNGEKMDSSEEEYCQRHFREGWEAGY